eukprot:764333-Hanusia_phi.AAC.1
MVHTPSGLNRLYGDGEAAAMSEILPSGSVTESIGYHTVAVLGPIIYHHISRNQHDCQEEKVAVPTSYQARILCTIAFREKGIAENQRSREVTYSTRMTSYMIDLTYNPDMFHKFQTLLAQVLRHGAYKAWRNGNVLGIT